jgi:hypothetical protein
LLSATSIDSALDSPLGIISWVASWGASSAAILLGSCMRAAMILSSGVGWVFSRAKAGAKKSGLRLRSPPRYQLVPPGRLERPHPAPEAGALSAELWGQMASQRQVRWSPGQKCTTRLPGIQGTGSLLGDYATASVYH